MEKNIVDLEGANFFFSSVDNLLILSVVRETMWEKQDKQTPTQSQKVKTMKNMCMS